MVAAFFKNSGSKTWDNMSNSTVCRDESCKYLLKKDSELEKEYRLASAERCKLPWRQDRLCVASVLPVDNSMHAGVSTLLPVPAVQDSTHRRMIDHCKPSMCELDSVQLLSVGGQGVCLGGTL